MQEFRSVELHHAQNCSCPSPIQRRGNLLANATMQSIHAKNWTQGQELMAHAVKWVLQIFLCLSWTFIFLLLPEKRFQEL
jgi:hypothetical protein